MFGITHQVDAQTAMAFVVEQNAHIEQKVNKTVYPEITYQNMIPVDTSAHPFTQTVVFFSDDMFGQAKWVNGNADDIPMAGTNRNMHKSAVHTAAIGYGYGWEEVNQAVRLGYNLQADDAVAARRAYEEMVQRIAYFGDPSKNMQGLLNYAGIAIQAATGKIETLTEDQILQHFNNLVLDTAIATNYTSIADTVMVSPRVLNYLATKRLGDTQETLLAWLLKNNTYTAMTGRPLLIRALLELEKAGSAGVSRSIGYRRSDDVMKMHIPMPHRFLPVWQRGALTWEVPGVFRLGGLDIRKPVEVRYLDGL